MLQRVVVLTLVMATLAHAQLSGRISGSVVDPSGAPVPGAEVSLTPQSSSKPIAVTKTTSEGLYAFAALNTGKYDLTITAAGFANSVVRSISVDPARETSVPRIQLELPSVTQRIEVTADIQAVETSSTEVSSVITMDQVHKLPVLDRDPLSLIQTQAGVVNNGNSNTVINGLRTSYSNMTLDGINIQDNYIRDNALDFSPNMLQLGQVRQLTLVTSNSNSAASGGASQVAFVTPSGTNEFHGELVWYNRNSFFSANDWFNNQGGVARPHLNQNQIGGSLGGPIRKDKLFFYSNYELVRIRQQTPTTTTILTPDARSGIFTYRNAAGAVLKTNLLTLRGITPDTVTAKLLQQVPGPENINNFTTGDSTPGLLRNTAGYRFNQRNNEDRDNVTTKVDYNLSTAHTVGASYIWNRQNTDRPDFDNGFSVIPRVTNPNHNNFISTSWRWTPSAGFTNEVRAGANLTAGDFLNSQPSPFFFTGTSYTDPLSEFQPQGRITNTYVLQDNASYQKGRHNIQFGYHLQKVRIRAYDNAGTIPTYNLFMGTGQPALSTRDLPGIRSADLANANALLATLGGYVDSASQTFNVTSRTSGYVPKAGQVRHLAFGEMDWYIQDAWKVFRRLTVTAGLRYQLPQVASERNGLEIQPVLSGTAPQTLLSNATLNFVDRWYKTDKRDFAPNIGLAWDVRGNSKTAVRAGYSMNYVNDQSVIAPQTIMEFNSGLIGNAAPQGLGVRAAAGLPVLAPPPFKIPITAADNYAADPTNAMGLVDPNLRTPYVQQWTAGVQHEFKQTIFELRYVGNHAVGSYRAFDFNQVDIKSNGFLDDFLRARSNAQLAQAATGVYNPAYNANIPGSQQLTVFPKLYRGGQLTNAANRNLILTGEAGQLAYEYQVNGLNGTVNFFPNPNALGADYLTNYSNSSYNSLQFEATRRTSAGVNFQGSYTFSKVLSDAAGDTQSRLEHFLDFSNPKIERARANFDLNHMIKANAIYDLPFLKKNRIFGGWSLGGIMTWQSGAPFSILSQRGTLNRSSGFRSENNTAFTTLTKSQLDQVVRFEMTGNGPFIVDSSAINPADGTGDYKVFSNPAPGSVGDLQRRLFSGPWTFTLNASIQKLFKITEHQSAELRMEGNNILNHATFYPGNQTINSTSFGAMTSMFYPSRIMQFGLTYKF